ncbi:hypothetical protein [Nocardia sp. N2S4-5]|uniref:hypothetical protein n=1 Tax=Nocardia sp. N2S4-5 TaxID=3351565 RepID=UPI0037D3DD47
MKRTATMALAVTGFALATAMSGAAIASAEPAPPTKGVFCFHDDQSKTVPMYHPLDKVCPPGTRPAPGWRN